MLNDSVESASDGNRGASNHLLDKSLQVSKNSPPDENCRQNEVGSPSSVPSLTTTGPTREMHAVAFALDDSQEEPAGGPCGSGLSPAGRLFDQPGEYLAGEGLPRGGFGPLQTAEQSDDLS